MSTLAPVGTVKRRWLRYISDCRELVMQRCTTDDDAYRCDGCGRIFIRRPRVLAHHHCFGRGKLVAEPLASHPDFGAGLCRACHREVHADKPGERNRLVCLAALMRAWETFGLEPAEPITLERHPVEVTTGGLFGNTPLELIHAFIPGALEGLPEIDTLNGHARSLERMLKDDGTWTYLLAKAGK